MHRFKTSIRPLPSESPTSTKALKQLNTHPEEAHPKSKRTPQCNGVLAYRLVFLFAFSDCLPFRDTYHDEQDDPMILAPILFRGDHSYNTDQLRYPHEE